MSGVPLLPTSESGGALFTSLPLWIGKVTSVFKLSYAGWGAFWTALNQQQGILADYHGGQPPYPRDLTHYGQKYEKRKGPHKPYGPHTPVTCFGARVASQLLPYPPNRHHNDTESNWIVNDLSYSMDIMKS